MSTREHGFNVSAPDAWKWGRILFKRFWHSGFNARLHMQTWEGNYSFAPGEAFNGLHYQQDAENPMKTEVRGSWFATPDDTRVHLALQ